jgi:hypothetical protein
MNAEKEMQNNHRGLGENKLNNLKKEIKIRTIPR